ncbi:MAG TPA: hypothetical protein VFZ10_09830 [Geminicoccaceae bacterium]
MASKYDPLAVGEVFALNILITLTSLPGRREVYKCIMFITPVAANCPPVSRKAADERLAARRVGMELRHDVVIRET